MIQRIQSLYLLLTTLFSVLFLTGNIITFNDSDNEYLYITLTWIEEIMEVTGSENIEKSLLLSVLLLLVPFTAFITIFIYKNRKLQMKLAIGLIVMILLVILVISYYGYNIITGYDARLVPKLNLIFPVLSLITSILAYRGIKKDDDLVKSYDRLR